MTREVYASDIDTRLRKIINQVVGITGKPWRTLEEETGIKTEKWRQFYRGTTKASSEMIEAFAKRWPQYALWIVFGDLDSLSLQIVPPIVVTISVNNESLLRQVIHDVDGTIIG